MGIQASTNQNYSRVLFFPTPPLEKRDFVGAPHTPPRGCRPLDPCFKGFCGDTPRSAKGQACRVPQTLCPLDPCFKGFCGGASRPPRGYCAESPRLCAFGTPHSKLVCYTCPELGAPAQTIKPTDITNSKGSTPTKLSIKSERFHWKIAAPIKVNTSKTPRMGRMNITLKREPG